MPWSNHYLEVDYINKSRNNLWRMRNLNLLWEITLSNFKLRNQGSVLGILWYLINPLLMLGVLFVVFSRNIGSSIPHYALYVLIGVLEWNFFIAATNDAMYSMESYSIMIRKVPFRKEVLISGVVLNIFISHIVEWILLIIILAFTVGLSTAAILLPLVMLLEFAFALAVSLLLGIIISFYKDIKSIWRNLVFIAWFLTPIFYLASSIPEKFVFINSINPMTWLIEMSRSILLSHQIPVISEFIIVFAAFSVLLIASAMIFKHFSVNIAERI